MEVERRDNSCVEDMSLDGDLGEPKNVLSAHVHLIFTIRKINHDRPFPSSFKAGVEKRSVVSLQSLSHIAKERGALVSSIAEQYAHDAASLVQNVLGSCITESGVQKTYWLQLRLAFHCCHLGTA